MKALAVDSAARCMTVSARNGDYTATLSLDIGQKQSQELLPSIDFVLSKAGLEPRELDYAAVCSGPGTFTGLRLSFSALKAITLAYGTPVYGIPSLDVYAYPFSRFDGLVVSVIAAKKNQFFASVHENGSETVPAEDTTAEKIIQKIGKTERNILTVGPDAAAFAEILKSTKPSLSVVSCPFQPTPTDTLFALAEKMMENKTEPLKDYDGPVYMRKSEAEIVRESSF